MGDRKHAEVTIAYHEAGHAVAEYRFGFVPVLVTIIGKDTVDGYSVREYGDEDGARREDEIVAYLAGHAAQLELARRTLDSGDPLPVGAFCGARSDLSVVIYGGRNYPNGLLLDGERIKQWMRKTRDFVKREWRAIDAVARELLECKTLDDAEIELTIDATDHNVDPRKYLDKYRALKSWSAT